MSFSIFPYAIFKNIYDISPHWLKGEGIKLLLLDFDNTILPYGVNDTPRQFPPWLESLKARGIKVGVVSNSGKKKVADFCRSHDLSFVQSALKPGSSRLKRLPEALGVPLENTAMAGDQLITDVLAANRSGAKSLFIWPIALSNPFLKLRHLLERPLIMRAQRRIDSADRED